MQRHSRYYSITESQQRQAWNGHIAIALFDSLKWYSINVMIIGDAQTRVSMSGQ